MSLSGLPRANRWSWEERYDSRQKAPRCVLGSTEPGRRRVPAQAGGAAMTANEHIDPEAVEAAFLDSLFRDEEVTPGVVPDGAVIVDGLAVTVGLHSTRLESHRQQVIEWLALMPHQFRKDSGGGWSSLNACLEADGTLWTQEQKRVFELLTLAIGLGVAKWLLPREDWGRLPGRMPYVQIEVPR